MAVLSGSPSKFEANDGNMVVDTAGNSDWNSVTGSPNYVHLTDVSNSTADDSFKSGQKQDTTCPVINTNKNPPKDDFTDVASFNETNFDPASPQFHHTFLDGATIRFTANGSASENVELNQGLNGTCTGTTLLARSKGDKLIAIDYTTGGTTVTFHVLTWIVDNSDPANASCFVKTDSPPCWGVNSQSLAANAAEGLTNQAAIAAADNGISGAALVVGQFAEFGVDLTAAGIIPANSCESFPQTVWESRSSGSSFVSSTEDVSVEHHTIANCGTLVVKKVTDPSPDPTGTSFSFHKTSSQDSVDRTFSLKNGGSDSETVFATNDFSVAETVPANWNLTSATCDNGSGTLSGSTLSGITVDIGKTTTCTFNDKLQLGAIKITKTNSKTGNGVAGAKFLITGPGNYSNSVTSGSDGTVCVDGLTFGAYSVSETSAPTGYVVDDTSAHPVTVNTNAKCSDSPYGGASTSFSDTPTSDIQVNFRDGGSGTTTGTITCDNTTGTGSDTPAPGWDTSHTVTGVHAPTTIHCTITIDP